MPTTRNPATEAEIATYRYASDAEVDAALATAADASETHRRSSFEDRARAMRRLADALDDQAPDLGALMTAEMGKPLDQAVAEARKCAWVCRYYADRAQGFLADEPRETEAARSFVAYEPLGPVLAVMPWNFPFWQVLRFAAPTVMAGGVGLLKHAEAVLGCGDRIAELFRQSGFAEGVFQHVVMDHDQTAGVIADGRVRAVTLTGSERAGRVVGRLAGARAQAVRAGAGRDRRLRRPGRRRPRPGRRDGRPGPRPEQRPVVHRRQAVHPRTARRRRVHPPLHRADAGAHRRRPDDGRRPRPARPRRPPRDGPGPGRPRRRRRRRGPVRRGGPDGVGFYYPPTVLAAVAEGTVAFDEEVFGPVASLTVAEDADDAVRLANATRFGLGGSVWTRDRDRGERVARAVRSGAVFVNEMTKSHPALPFGGVGASGYGRELGRAGIRAFTNAKTVWID